MSDARGPLDAAARADIERLRATVERVFRGKPETVELSLVTMLAGGHLLLEDIPGTGKTTLATTLARALDLSFRRIQFTSDLLPSDITGVSILDRDAGEFVFKRGPLFAHVVLADEINRATPRTQSSLLEAMNEGHVTVDDHTHALPVPFLVLATQNPLELHGTYPLPESQMDRFLMRLEIGHPEPEIERDLLRDYAFRAPYDDVEPVLDVTRLLAIRDAVDHVHLSDRVLDYVQALAQATRESERLVYGLSTRAAIHLFRAAKALALVRGRDFVTPDDVRELFVPVCAHRLTARGAASRDRHGHWLVDEIVDVVPVPV